MFGMETPERSPTDITAGQTDPLSAADKHLTQQIQDTLFMEITASSSFPSNLAFLSLVVCLV